MCSRPIEMDDNVFACRSCDECLATRRHQWVCRAMMEKACWPETICLALSYDDTSQANRDAAAMFQYDDVRLFLARLRQAAHAFQPGARLRFLIACEQGDRNGRCHWHCIIYSSVKLWSLGEVVGFKSGSIGKQPLTSWDEIKTTSSTRRRVNWSLWGKGFVTFQEPDEGGMHYVLSYVLKDQFTPEKSKDTARESRVDNFSTGLFRMSKRPAIGEQWLYGKFSRLDASGSVLPSLEMTIPGMKGFYHPSGSFREKTLWALRALNQRAFWATGQNAPQWSSLVTTCQDNLADMEVLNGAPQDDDFQSLDGRLARDQSSRAGATARRSFARCCGNELPCQPCLSNLSDAALETLGVCRDFEEGSPRFKSCAPGSVAERQGNFLGRSNPYCERRGYKISRLTFPSSDPTDVRLRLQASPRQK